MQDAHAACILNILRPAGKVISEYRELTSDAMRTKDLIPMNSAHAPKLNLDRLLSGRIGESRRFSPQLGLNHPLKQPSAIEPTDLVAKEAYNATGAICGLGVPNIPARVLL